MATFAPSPGEERRRWSRMPVAIPVFIRGEDAQGRDFTELATTVDFSSGGALLMVRNRIPQGAPLELEIPRASLGVVPNAVRNFEARTVRAGGERGFQYLAVEFVSPLATK